MKITEIIRTVYQYGIDQGIVSHQTHTGKSTEELDEYCEYKAKQIRASLWTSVEDGLPEDGVCCLLMTEPGGRKKIRFGHYSSPTGAWWDEYGNVIYGVTHYQPITEPGKK